jgi:hypothetical protein
VYTLMTEYERRDSRLMNIKLADFRPLLTRNAVKMLRLTLLLFSVTILAGVLFVVLSMLSAWTLVLTIPAMLIFLIALMIPFNLVTAIYLFEDIPLIEALKKSFRYGFSAWGETFMIVLVCGLLANIVSGVTMIPWYFVLMFGQIFSVLEAGADINSAIWYQFLIYILGIIQSYGMYASYILSAIGIAFQYFHIREKKEGISVDASIQDFDRL